MPFRNRLHAALGDAPGQHGALLVKQASGYLMSPTTLTTTLLGIQARLYVSPLYIPRPMKVRGIACNVTVVGGAGAVLRVGLYRDNGDGSAEKLLFDFGEPPFNGLLDTSLIGLRTAVFAAADRPGLRPGLYWIASSPQGAPAPQATVTAIDGTIMIAPTSWMTPTDTTFVGYRKEGADTTTGALPDRTGNPFFFGSQGPIPRVGLEITSP